MLYLLHRPVALQASIDHDGQAGAYHLALQHIVRGEQQGSAHFAHVAEHHPNLLLGTDIHAGGGLVEADESVGQHSHGDIQFPFGAHTVVLDFQIEALREHKAFGQFANNDRNEVLLNATAQAGEFQHVPARHIVQQDVLLRTEADVQLTLFGQRIYVDSLYVDFATGNDFSANYHAQSARLAGTVRSHQAEAFITVKGASISLYPNFVCDLAGLL